jgi:undecaprenyl-diphosphatase
MSQLSYLEAIVMGAVQGISELFPVSSLGHSVLIPAIVGGQWAKDLNVAAPQSPYLAFIVGLHVATALALLVFFWRDWVRIIGGLITSIRFRRVKTPPERMAWLLILATIPVGIAGLLFDKLFRVIFGQPMIAAAFLAANGLVLFAGEALRRRSVRMEAAAALAAPATAGAVPTTRAEAKAAYNAEFDGGDTLADQRISTMPIGRGVLIGSSQILALLAGISRSGVTMVSGMAAGLSHREAARFGFLLATPVIFAAGLLKLPDLFGSEGHGILGQVLAGSAASFICALIAVSFLDRYFRTRTLIPFAIYCLVAGIGAFVWLAVRP